MSNAFVFLSLANQRTGNITIAQRATAESITVVHRLNRGKPVDEAPMTEAVSFENYLETLNHIQTRLLSMPEEEALSDTFAIEQNKLAELIEKLAVYSPEEQEKAREIMRDFAEKLNLKLTQLKLRMEQLSDGMDQHQNRMRGMKAYGQGKIF